MSTVVITRPKEIKSSLQSLVLKRLQNSKNEIDMKSLWEKEEKKYELSHDEIEKITARKMQNKKAARKSREKFKNRIQLLEKEHAKLSEENGKLMMEIGKLKEEIRLVRQINSS
ncbi:hypothetical protein SNE40_009196 [Patella caerulea]|uniref:BZIP domain-containing protein n=1 Tax=Patella caerulea TaxID=87958 RepID=A0AAN8JS18_PATCE